MVLKTWNQRKRLNNLNLDSGTRGAGGATSGFAGAPCARAKRRTPQAGSAGARAHAPGGCPATLSTGMTGRPVGAAVQLPAPLLLLANPRGFSRSEALTPVLTHSDGHITSGPRPPRRRITSGAGPATPTQGVPSAHVREAGQSPDARLVCAELVFGHEALGLDLAGPGRHLRGRKAGD